MYQTEFELHFGLEHGSKKFVQIKNVLYEVHVRTVILSSILYKSFFRLKRMHQSSSEPLIVNRSGLQNANNQKPNSLACASG